MSRKIHKIGNDGHRLSRRKWLAALGMGGAASLAGCAGDSNSDDDGTSPDEVSVSGTYDAVTSASFETLNPLYNTEDGAGTAIGYALDLGYTFDENNEYFPLLYDMSTENGEVWVFNVREGLEFSDPYGEVTAETFVYQIQELHQTSWANTADAPNWGENINVEQTGDYEFQAELPNAQLLWPESYDPLLYPIPRDLVEPYVQEEDVEGLQQDEELLELQFTGNLGAFSLDEWTRGSGTTYTRNDDYYIQNIDEGPDLFGGAPYFEGASISVVGEQASRLGALQTGEADSAAIPPNRFAEFDSDQNVDVYQIPQPYNEIVSVNMRDNGWNGGPGNLFRYKEFRQAMAAAISKEDLISGVFNGLAREHYTWQPEWSRFYPEDADLPTYGTGDLYGADVAQEFAQQAFERSEYEYSFDGDTLVNPSGDQVALTILHSAGQETEKLECQFVAEELGDNLGLDVTVEAIDGTRFANEYWNAEPTEAGASDTVNGEEVVWENPNQNNPGPRSVTSNESWDMSMVFGLNTYPLNPLTNSVFFNGANAFYNPVGYYPEFDAQSIFEDANAATSEEEIQTALQDLFVNIAEEQPYIMLAFPDSLTGYNPDLVGPIENFNNGWDFPAWYFDE